MAAIVHCEIRVADLERAKRFYTTVFDWIIEPVGSGKYWLVRAGRAHTLPGKPPELMLYSLCVKAPIQPRNKQVKVWATYAI
jgi:catechol 2,3-dioxygenase-like lactoylglutathione lyase family enzyme